MTEGLTPMQSRGKSKYRSYTRVDYVLLPVVLLANILLVPWALPLLPGLGAITGWFTPLCIITVAPLGCAYLWQLAAVNQYLALNMSGLIAVAVVLYLIGFKMDDRDSMISGVLGFELVFWTLLRWALSTRFGEQKSEPR